MKLSDVVDPSYGLCRTDSKFIGRSFGPENQLRVVGWSGLQKNGKNRYYIVKCTICSVDSELFGEGYFKISTSNLTHGKLPCGCAPSPRWTKEQREVLCRREAASRGYEFKGFIGPWKYNSTTLKLCCPSHGTWCTTALSSFISGVGCPQCNGGIKKPDSEMIKNFMSTGSFHPDTIFSRSDKKDSRNQSAYWDIYCPVCESNATASYSNLGMGRKPCLCNKQYIQDKAYINLVYDLENVVAVKFGVTSDVRKRVHQQDYKSSYTVINHSSYKFTTPKQAYEAEKECKGEFVCGIVLKRDMPDGYTETTYTYNIEKIIDVYTKHGGLRLEHCNELIEGKQG